MLFKVRTYDDFKRLITGSTTETLYHFDGGTFFAVWARTISPVGYVVEFQDSAMPLTFGADFPGSNILDQPLSVS